MSDDTPPVKFSIYLPTYNRNELLVKTIDSLVAQTYGNFELFLYDNGSVQPAKEIVNSYHDERIVYTRFEENQNTCDLAEDAINRMSGSHFLFLADDDVLVPSALSIVANIINQHKIEILQTGFALFSHIHRTVDLTKVKINCFNGKLEELDAQEAALHYCNGWGIGRKRRYRAPKMAHSSGIFIEKSLIEKTRNCQGELFIKPFGDIGYVGALLHAEKCHYLDLPLAIVGETQVREMNGAMPGQRHKWVKEIQYLEYSPLNAASFQNMGTDAHLKVLLRNNWGNRYDYRLRPHFYIRHLKQVMSDSPWTAQTLKDVAECIPHYAASLFYELYPANLLQLLARKWKKAAFPEGKPFNAAEGGNADSPQHGMDSTLHFEDINGFAEWLDRNCIQCLVSLAGSD